MPITGTASLVAIPANLVVAPLVNVAFPLAASAAVAGIAWAPLGEVLLLPARLCAELVIALVAWLAALPGAAPLGTVSRPMMLVVTFAAAGTVVALSAEGRSWARRLPTTLRGATLYQWAALIGILAGTAVGVISRWLA